MTPIHSRMTIIYKNVPIHECTELLIVNPLIKIHGYTVGHPLDDFILHEHGKVHAQFFEFKPDLGSVQYVESEGIMFANAIVGEIRCKFNPWHIINTLMLIREYAIQEDILNDIAISLYSYTLIPGGENIKDVLNIIFKNETITIYTGTEHMIDYHMCDKRLLE